MELELYRQEKNRRISLAILSGALIIILAFWISYAFNLSLISNIVMAWVLTDVYMLFLIFLARKSDFGTVIRQVPVERIIEIKKPVFIEKQVIKEVPVQIPVENKTFEIIEKPVIKEVPVYIERPRVQLNIPKYKFIGSTETKRFHKKSCRLSKLIKNKYKIQSNSKEFFKRKHFKPCKICLH